MTQPSTIAAFAVISVAVATYLALFFFRSARRWRVKASYWRESSRRWQDACNDVLQNYEESAREVGRLRAREMASRAKAIRGSEGWWRN